jgi:hypothetical protein
MGHSLDEILRDTLLLTAQPRLQPLVSFKVPRIEPWSPVELARVQGVQLTDGEQSVILNKRIWEYQLDGPTRIRNVTVRHRQFGDRQLAVCDRVQWGPVKVVSKGHSFDLPLSEDHLLRTYFLFDGRIRDSSAGLWQLPMCIHSSFMSVFGYEVDPASDRLRPIRKELLTHPEMMAPAGRNALEQPVSVAVGKTLVSVHGSPESGGLGQRTVV